MFAALFVVGARFPADARAAQIGPPGPPPQDGPPAEAQALDLTGLWPAPAGTWVCADGSLARSRATDTPVGRGRLEQRWRRELPAPLSEEALVSGDACLALTSDSGKHFGQWFDLRSGQPIGSALAAELPLAPCLAGNRAVLRLGPDRLVGIEVDADGWREVCAWTIPSVGEPLFDGERVYVRDARGLQRLTWGQAQPAARLDLDLIGRLAWLPEGLVVLARSSKGGNFHWTQVPFDLSAASYGPAALPLDAVDRGAREARLYPGALKHYYQSADIHWNGSSMTWLVVGPELGLIAGKLERDPFSSVLHAAPAQCAQGSLGWLRDRTWERDYLALAAAQDRWVIYGPTLEFEQRGPRSVTIGRDGVWIDRRAISLDGESLLQLLPGADPRWVVPTLHGPLLCRGQRSLELWGPIRPAVLAQRPPWTDWPAEVSAAAVLEDPKAVAIGDPEGPVLVGPLQISAGRLAAREPEPAPRKGRQKPSAGIEAGALSLWIAGDGRLLYARDWAAFERGLSERLRLSAATALAEGSLPAQQSSAAPVIQRALAVAREFRLESEIEKLAAALERVERQGRKARADRAEVAQAALDGFDAERQALFERAFADLIGEAPDELGWAALRAGLDQPPLRDHARRCIDRALPSGLEADLGSPRLRLELARLHARRGVELVGVEGGRAAPAQSVLAEELIRARWQPDWIGLLSPDLLVFGPRDRFDDLVLALLRGQLLADQLAGFLGATPQPIDAALFESSPAERPRRPLAVSVLGAKGDAQRFEARRQLQPAQFFDVRRALFDEGNALTLVHWPAGSAKLGAQEPDLILALTQHWLELRCPLYTDTRQARGGPGYWARVGLPLMAAEMRFDLPSDSAVLDLDHSQTAVFLSTLDRELWLPWPKLVAQTAPSIELASQQPLASIELPWLFNQLYWATTRELHWAQSAQLCAALLVGEGQTQRPEFARVLAAYHRGDAEQARLLREGGLDANALERLMQAHLEQLQPPAGQPGD